VEAFWIPRSNELIIRPFDDYPLNLLEKTLKSPIPERSIAHREASPAGSSPM